MTNGDHKQPRFETHLSDECVVEEHTYPELDRWGDLLTPYRFTRDWYRDDYGVVRLVA